jgi:adenylylsulfate kinase
LYAKVREGAISHFTGFSAPYEAPDEPELTLKSDELSVTESVDRLFSALREAKILS